MDKILHLIGLARKAGKLEIGEEPVGASTRARKARLVLLAGDAAENSVRRARHFVAHGAAVLVETSYTKAELGDAVGRTSCAMLALTDAGLSAALVKGLAGADPERYGEAAALLEKRADKVRERQKEQLRHERKLQRSKKTPWAPSGGTKKPEPPQTPQAGTHPAPRPRPKGRIHISGTLKKRPGGPKETS